MKEGGNNLGGSALRRRGIPSPQAAGARTSPRPTSTRTASPDYLAVSAERHRGIVSYEFYVERVAIFSQRMMNIPLYNVLHEVGLL